MKETSATSPDGLLKAAWQVHRQGRPAEALAMYKQVLAHARKHPHALHLLGVCQHDLGDFVSAERNIRSALKLLPSDGMMHLSYGNALRELGRLGEAIRSYERAARLEPNSGLVHFNLATALEECGRSGEAMEAYERARALEPGAQAHFGIGNCLLAMGRPEEAVVAYEQALGKDQGSLDIRVNFSVALARSGRRDEARQQLRAVLVKQRGHMAAGRALLPLLDSPELAEEALALIEQMRARSPQDPELICMHARELSRCRRLEEAAALWDRARAQRPGDATAVAQLAWHWAALGRADSALALCEESAARFPDDLALLFSSGVAQFQLGDLGEARATFAKILDRQPEFPGACLELAMLDLLAGDYERGWMNFEDRLKDPGSVLPGRAFRQSRWRGSEELGSSTLFVHCEQGLGDTVQFCRFVPLLVERAGKIILEVPAPAFSLVARGMPPSVTVVRYGSSLPAFDWTCPLMSLPLVLRTTLENVPAPRRYLEADARRVRIWQRRLGKPRGRRIGIAWSGNPLQLNDAQKRIALARLRPLLQATDAGGQLFEFIALQNEIRESDRQALAGSQNLTYLGEAIGDLDDTAALIELCELVISVDTSVAHTAGAIGKTVWIMLPFVPDWRWLLAREDSPWYPSARLFRQVTRGDWESVVASVARALTHWRQRSPADGRAAAT